MRASVKTLIWYLSSTHDLKAPIVDLGSRQAMGQHGFADLRPFFKGKEYRGCDAEAGVGVDGIENIEALSFKDKSIPTILCLDTIEHVANPLQAMKEMYRCLTDDGVLILTSHMYAPVHYKIDYWRFTAQCFKEVLLKEFPEKEILIQGEPNFPENIVGIASKGVPNPFKIDMDELNGMLPWPYPFMFQRLNEEPKEELEKAEL